MMKSFMKDKKSIILICVLLAAILGLVMYIALGKNNQFNKCSNNSVNIEKEEVDASMEYYNELFNRYYASCSCDGNNMLILKNSITRFDDINEEDAFKVVLDTFFPKYSFPRGDESEGPSIVISKKVYEEEYHRFWGSKQNPIYNDTNLNLGNPVKITDDYIEIYPVGGYGCGCFGVDGTYFDIEDVKIDDTETVLMIKCLYFEGIYENNEISASKAKIYKDVEKKFFIAEDKIDKSDDIKSRKKLEDKYKSKAGTYKVTFKNDTNGNLYWYSTQFIK